MKTRALHKLEGFVFVFVFAKSAFNIPKLNLSFKFITDVLFFPWAAQSYTEMGAELG